MMKHVLREIGLTMLAVAGGMLVLGALSATAYLIMTDLPLGALVVLAQIGAVGGVMGIYRGED